MRRNNISIIILVLVVVVIVFKLLYDKLETMQDYKRSVNNFI